jgi:hypothetical protein
MAVALILVTRCVDAEEAFSFVDGRLMAMIFAMLAVGQGLDHSGAVALIVDAVAPYMAGLVAVPDDPVRVFPWADADRVPVEQCGGGDLYADCD